MIDEKFIYALCEDLQDRHAGDSEFDRGMRTAAKRMAQATCGAVEPAQAAPAAVVPEAVADAEAKKCGLCGESEAFTGTCGGGRENPKALCFEGPEIDYDIADRIVDAAKAFGGGDPDGTLTLSTDELRKIVEHVLADQEPASQAAVVPEGWRLVPVEFIRGFGTLAHNYSLTANAPDYYHGVERDAFRNAYARCGHSLASLRSMLEWKPPTAQAAAVPEAVADVLAERVRQDAQWGGPSHDDEHSVSDWRAYIQKQMTKGHGWRGKNARPHFVKVAALAVAAIESIDRLAAKPTGKEQSS